MAVYVYLRYCRRFIGEHTAQHSTQREKTGRRTEILSLVLSLPPRDRPSSGRRWVGGGKVIGLPDVNSFHVSSTCSLLPATCNHNNSRTSSSVVVFVVGRQLRAILHCNARTTTTMPALHLFHRRTLLAGDDLQLPSIAWGASFAVQLFGFLPCLLYYTIALLLMTSTSSISILLLSSSSPEEYFDDGSLNDNLVVDTRQLYYDYYSSTNDDAEDAYNSNTQSTIMQSAECNNSTSGYTDMRFPHLILVYLIGMAIYTSTSIYYERRIFQLSSIGTPTINTHLRNAPLAELIEFKMISLAGMNFIFLVHGIFITCMFLSEYIQCFPTIWWIVWAASLLFQIVQCLLTVTTLVSLWRVHPVAIVPASSPSNHNVTTTDFYHRHHADTTTPFHHTHNNIEIAEEMWRSRCQGCCRIMAISTCFLFGGRGIVSHAAEDGGGGGEKFYGDIARALADYFADFGDYENSGTIDGGGVGLDVVPSDIGLGIVLLRHIQAQRKMLAQRDALQQREQQTDATAVSIRASTDRSTLLFRRSTSQVSSSPGGDCESPVPPHTEEEAYRSFSRTVLSSTNSEHYALIEEGAHFSRHQLAIYTVRCSLL